MSDRVRLLQVGQLQVQVQGGQEKCTSLLLDMGKLFLLYVTIFFLFFQGKCYLKYCSNKISVKTYRHYKIFIINNDACAIYTAYPRNNSKLINEIIPFCFVIVICTHLSKHY